MHFAILTQYYPPEIGAPQARLSNLACHFRRHGHAVTVLTAMPNYPLGKIYHGYRGLLRREKIEGIEVIRTFIYPTQKTDFVRRLTNYFSFVISSVLLGGVLLQRPDYLLVESPPLFLGLSAFILSRWKRTPLIFNVSDLWPESAVHLGYVTRRSLSYRLASWLEAFCYRRSWLVTGQSRGILENIGRRFPSVRLFPLPNGVDSCRFTPQRSTRQAREILGGHEGLVVLYAGLHGSAQGLDQVLEAAENLQDEKQCRFVLIGDGPEKNRLVVRCEQQHLQNVKFLDLLPADEMPPIIAAADVMIVPLGLNLPGAVPSKLYEAMASARAVIVIAEGEAAEIVREHKAGLVVRPGDIEGLVAAVRQLLRNPSLGREFGENGRKAAVQYYNRKDIAETFITYLEQRTEPRSTNQRVSLRFKSYSCNPPL